MTLRKVEMSTLSTGACRYFLPNRGEAKHDADEEQAKES
jgi:hypothetical protein